MLYRKNSSAYHLPYKMRWDVSLKGGVSFLENLPARRLARGQNFRREKISGVGQITVSGQQEREIELLLVIENIIRHRQMGKDARQAAVDGTKEITLAVMVPTIYALIHERKE